MPLNRKWLSLAIIIVMTNFNPRLLQLASPNLPVGAYSYSQGLETAVEQEWVSNKDQLQDWITASLRHNLKATDMPLLQRLYMAWASEDLGSVNHWNAMVYACRESAEVHAQEQQMGSALNKLLWQLGLEPSALGLLSLPSFLSQYALAGQQWNIEPQVLLMTYLWTWCENQIMAAIKLFPLGQTQGQILLSRVSEEFPMLLQQASLVEDEDIGQTLPALSQALAMHETQYSRMFRS